MSRKNLLTALTALVTIALAGCDADDANNGTGNDGSVAGMCDSQCHYEARCVEPDVTKPTFEVCKASCIAKLGTKGAYRTDAMAALGDCYETLACDVSDDQCLVAAVAVVTSSPTTDPLAQTCVARQDECALDGTSDFSDDNCATQLIMTESARSSFEACLSQACEQIDACIDDVTGRS